MGKLYNGEYFGDCIGRVENDGKVYNGEYFGDCVGRVEDGKYYSGGAAILLLIR